MNYSNDVFVFFYKLLKNMGFTLVTIEEFDCISLTSYFYQIWFEIDYNPRIHALGYHEVFWENGFKLNVSGGTWDYDKGDLRLMYSPTIGGD